MMKLKILIPTILGISLLVISTLALAQWKPLPTEDDRLKGSYRFERNGWVYVHLEGAPERVVLYRHALRAAIIGSGATNPVEYFEICVLLHGWRTDAFGPVGALRSG